MGSAQPFSLIVGCLLAAVLVSTDICGARAESGVVPAFLNTAERLFEASRSHMGVGRIRRVIIQKGEQLEIDYELADRGRYATSLIDSTGRLLQFSVNSPDNRRDYQPIKERGTFIRRVIQVLSPATTAAERDWVVHQLDDPVRQWTPSFPIVVGSFVYRLHRANMHDYFEVTAADANTPGWRYAKR